MTTEDRDTADEPGPLSPPLIFKQDVAVHPEPADEIVRRFETGACRDTDHNKIDPEGFLSPTVIRAYSHYMQRNQTLVDGSTRASDNWQGSWGKGGIPTTVYMKSMWRHFLDVWSLHRGLPAQDDADMETALCALLFNVFGMLHETLRDDIDE